MENNKLNKNQIALFLFDRKNPTNKQVGTIIDSSEEIIFFSIGEDFDSNETVVYAFESNVEIARYKGQLKSETAVNKVLKEWKPKIIKTNKSYQEYLQK